VREKEHTEVVDGVYKALARRMTPHEVVPHFGFHRTVEGEFEIAMAK
jgi:hypothetical protein